MLWCTASHANPGALPGRPLPHLHCCYQPQYHIDSMFMGAPRTRRRNLSAQVHTALQEDRNSAALANTKLCCSMCCDHTHQCGSVSIMSDTHGTWHVFSGQESRPAWCCKQAVSAVCTHARLAALELRVDACNYVSKWSMLKASAWQPRHQQTEHTC